MQNAAAKEKIIAVIEADDAIAFTRDLVRIPSIFPREAECAALLADQYRACGLDVVLQEVEPGRPNVIGTLAGHGESPRLLIEGHTDVVALGDEAKWTVDPWGGEIIDGRLYGRGASDMKSGLAAAAIAARAIVRAGIKLNGTLQLAGFIDEENMMSGVRHFVREGGAKGLGAAITTEPTFGLGIGTCFCGRTRADITFLGQPGHAGIPPGSTVGKNAVHMAWRLIKAVNETVPPHQPHNLYGPSHWQVVSITGGDLNEATIPETCTVRIDARPVPGHDAASIWRYVDDLLAEFRRDDPSIETRVRLVEDYGTSSWSTDPEADIVRATQAAYRAVVNRDSPLNRVTQIPPGSGHTLKVSTDVHHIAALGIPCLNIGAGGANAHMADEYVDVEDIPLLAKILALTAIDYLGVV
ncbi:M20 family metallopeptidase [Phreatobacter stygius]|uniref:M20 family metallopeptidase n=1 Tax=Phreatobacter stygius TaxID=1940610 RepID=A0A4D7BIJ6_9HYPH|nr:M20/M25/M40 family metallo-hydrolase [Phreatobacter stygius]QCI67662.1 M20 family metallopeptidase [Phreatobacter stygius]